MRVVQLLSHAVESFDMLKTYHHIGVEAFDIGPYIDPAHPHVDTRPPLPEVPFFPELKAAVDALGTPDNLTAAQTHIPDALLDWLDNDGAVVIHHYTERLIADWPRLRDWMRGSAGRRIIWRSVGQSVEYNEQMMAPLRREGLERVAYSPKEANIPSYCGHDAVIRFAKDPAEWYGWTGEVPVVINITQHLAQRDPYTNFGFWDAATSGLSRLPLGPGSEAIGGAGSLSYDEMRGWLRRARAYLYTGTQPASYTLGLIEAMMTGIPVVSIGPEWMRVFPYGPALFEGHELVPRRYSKTTYDDEAVRARSLLTELLHDPVLALSVSAETRAKAISLFGIDTIGPQWQSYLGTPTRAVPVAVGAAA